MDHKYRGACDACHTRKTRCTLDGPGACLNCQNVGRSCVFSLRDEMGRPRKLSSKSKDKVRKQSLSAEVSSGQQTPRISRNNSASEQQLALPTDLIGKELDIWKSNQEVENVKVDKQSNDSETQHMPLVREDHSIMADSSHLNVHLHEVNGIVWQNFPMIGGVTSLPTPPEPNQNVMDFVLSMNDEDKLVDNIAMAQEFNRADQQESSGFQLTKHLTEAMFQFGAQAKFQWKYNDEDLATQAAVLQTVAKLCQLIQTIVTFGIYGPPVTEPQKNCQSSVNIQTLRMLVATAIFSVMSCYQNLDEAYKTFLFNQSLVGFENYSTETHPGDNMQKAEFTNYAPANLTRAINLVTMDFHLAMLKDAFTILQLNQIDGQADCAIHEAEIQRLRMSLQQTARFLRSS